MTVFINGIGVVGSFGCGVDALMQSLNRGDYPSPVLPGETGSAAFYPSYEADTSCLSEFVSRKVLRRIDHFSRLALTGAFLALKDAGLDFPGTQRTGLVICSGYGSAKTTFSFLDSLIDYGDSCASPTLFSNSVHNSASGHISIILGLDGPCLTVSQFEMSVHSALLSAVMWLSEGRADQILFGAVDGACDVLKYCYRGFFGDRRDVSMTPLTSGKQSAIPGEGAVFFILSKERLSDKNYGPIESVMVKSIFDRDLHFPENSFCIVNADGHRECDMRYSDILPEGAQVSCYTPVYGSMPVGPAFDMAIASISLRDGALFPSVQPVGSPAGLHIIREHRKLGGNSISCLKIGRQGELGIITMSDHR